MATKKGMTTNFFNPSLLLLFLDPGSGMGKNQDPESGINIPDPQHCFRCKKKTGRLQIFFSGAVKRVLFIVLQPTSTYL